MKRCAAVLVVLVCLCEAVAQTNVDADTLRDMVLQLTQRMKNMEAEVKEQQNLVTGLQVELSVTRNEMEAHLTKLSSVETRLDASQRQVEELERHNADIPKVAFSVGLSNSSDLTVVGPFGLPTTLVYHRVMTNIGNAYNSSTGVFKVPVKGVYYFRFTATHKSSDEDIGIKMCKNKQRLIFNYGYNNHGWFEYISNGLLVEAETGDTVYMVLPRGMELADSSANHNTFSGFLLYPM